MGSHTETAEVVDAAPLVKANWMHNDGEHDRAGFFDTVSEVVPVQPEGQQ